MHLENSDAQAYPLAGPVSLRNEPMRNGIHDQELQDLLIVFDGFATPGRLRPGWKKRAEREHERAQRRARATANPSATQETPST